MKKKPIVKEPEMTAGCRPDDDEEKTLFIRTECCCAPEIAVYVKGQGWELRCYECGKHVGLTIVGPELEKCGCAECGRGGE